MRELDTTEVQSVAGGNALLRAYYNYVVKPLFQAANTPGAQQRAVNFNSATGENIYGRHNNAK